MQRAIVVFFICVGCFVSSGCVIDSWTHSLPHPHSELTAPTFCLYEGAFRLSGDLSELHKKPEPIHLIRVKRLNKVNDEPIDWNKWREYGDIRPSIDQVAWKIEYAPDGKSEPPERRFSCITYGEVPPGYIEMIPAQPLIPERLYSVLVQPGGVLQFVIRADSQGEPTHLEYAIDSPLPSARTGGVHVMTRE